MSNHRRQTITFVALASIFYMCTQATLTAEEVLVLPQDISIGEILVPSGNADLALRAAHETGNCRAYNDCGKTFSTRSVPIEGSRIRIIAIQRGGDGHAKSYEISIQRPAYTEDPTNNYLILTGNVDAHALNTLPISMSDPPPGHLSVFARNQLALMRRDKTVILDPKGSVEIQNGVPLISPDADNMSLGIPSGKTGIVIMNVPAYDPQTTQPTGQAVPAGTQIVVGVNRFGRICSAVQQQDEQICVYAGAITNLNRR